MHCENWSPKLLFWSGGVKDVLSGLRGFLRPVFPVAWVGIALICVWEIQTHLSDTTLALTAGALLGLSLVGSRYVLGLGFTAAPTLYLVVLGLFHLGLVVPWALGVYDIGRIPWFNPHGLSRALELIIYSILCFQAGLFIAFATSRRESECLQRGGSDTEDVRVFSAGCLLLIAGVWMFVTGLIQLDPVGYYRITYSEIFRLQAESDPRFFGSGITVAFIGSYLAAAGASQRQLRWAFVGTGLWISMLFYLGFRGPALIAGLVVYAVALRKEASIPKWLPALTVAFLMVAIPIELKVREDPLNDRVAPSFAGMNLLDGPAEMGTSIRPLVETADLIGPGGYRLGKTYLVGLEGVLPNLSLRWQPGPNESIEELPPSHWITAVTEPWTYKNYGGIGFSAVAEPYMNFGTPGVIAFFILLGYLLAQLEFVSIRSSYGLAVWALVLGSLLWTTRNDFSSFFRPAVWGLACLGLVRLSSLGYSAISRTTRRGERAAKSLKSELRLG